MPTLYPTNIQYILAVVLVAYLVPTILACNAGTYWHGGQGRKNCNSEEWTHASGSCKTDDYKARKGNEGWPADCDCDAWACVPKLPCNANAYDLYPGDSSSYRRCVCNAGWKSDGTSLADVRCTVCAAGTYSRGGRVQSATCIPRTSCEYDGHTLLTEGSTTAPNICQCATGFAFVPSLQHSSCVACTEGHYKPEKGEGSCLQCPPGKYQDERGKSLCKDCTTGKCPRHGMAKPDDCGTGHIPTSPYKSVCKACEAGEFSSTDTAITCAQCSRGTYQNLEGASTCKLCKAGSIVDKPTLGSTLCTSCPRGGYSTTDGSTTCKLCSPGEYQPQFGQTSCLVCDKNTYTNEVKQQTCKHCNSSTDGALYVIEEGQMFQITNPVDVLTGSSACTCQAGYYKNNPVCSPCVAGKYKGDISDSECEFCSAGTFSMAAASICTTCAAGKIAPDIGSIACSSCSSGTATDQSSTACTACNDGTFATGTGNVHCTPAWNNWYTNSNKDDQDKCPPNSITNGRASDIFDCRCKMGYRYTNNTGDDGFECHGCEPGTYSNTTHSNRCYTCGTGEVGNSGFASTGCSACSKGSYASTSGVATCTVCPHGSTTLINGSKSVMDCVCGADAAITETHICAAGDASDYIDCNGQTGSWGCKACPIGSYSVSVGSRICYECPYGSTTAGIRATSSDDCVCTALYGTEFGSSKAEPNDGFLTNLRNGTTYGLYSVTLFSRYNADTQRVDCLNTYGDVGFVSVTHGTPSTATTPYPYPASDGSGQVPAIITSPTAYMSFQLLFDADSYGAGTYVVNVSGCDSNVVGCGYIIYDPIKASNDTIRTELQNTLHRFSTYPAYTDGSFNSDISYSMLSNTDDDDYLGSWISVIYPVAFTPKLIYFHPGPDASGDLPALFKLFGRNEDSEKWITVHDQTTKATDPMSNIPIDNDQVYSQLYLVVKTLRSNGATRLGMNHFKIWGQPMQPYLETSRGGGDDGGGVGGVISLYGDEDTQLTWSQPLPSSFTMCWVSRYHGIVTQNAILMDSTGAYYGHKTSKKTGYIYENMDETNWDSGSESISVVYKIDSMKWLIQCVVSSTGISVIDQTVVGTPDPYSSTSQDRYLTINAYHGQRSAFNIHSVYVWNNGADTHVVDLEEVTAALRREIGGMPYMGKSAVTPIVSGNIYHHRIGTILSPILDTDGMCTFLYPPTYRYGGPVSAQETVGSLRQLFSATSDTTAYATGIYTVSYSSSLSSIPMEQPAALLFDTDANIPVSFAAEMYENDANGCVYKGNMCLDCTSTPSYKGDWMTMKAPVQFKLTHYEIVPILETTADYDPSPASYVIYGSNTGDDWHELKHVTSTETGKISLACSDGPCLDRFSTYGILVTRLVQCSGSAAALKFLRLKLWGMPCEAGRYHSQTTHSCVFCELGTYSTTWGHNGCSICPAGTTTIQPGSTSVRDCVHPTLFDENRNSRCIPGHTYVTPTQGVVVDVVWDGGGENGLTTYVVSDSIGSTFIVHNFTHVSGALHTGSSVHGNPVSAYTQYTLRVRGTKGLTVIADVLVVAGGGGGGGGSEVGCGGAGGGGGVNFKQGYEMRAGTAYIPIRVGGGGRGSTSYGTCTSGVQIPIDGELGSPSLFGDFVTTTGGGGGGSVNCTNTQISRGLPGAYGGGVGATNGIYPTNGFLNGGGATAHNLPGCIAPIMSDSVSCGGGGGAGGPATHTSDMSNMDMVPPAPEYTCPILKVSHGGPGLSFLGFGTNVAVGGGGAGTNRMDTATGSSSHGGGKLNHENGYPHTGGGGMGRGETSALDSGNGGSGSIMVRFPLATCIPCAPGTFLDWLECMPCPPGSFAEYPGSTMCMPCPGGSYAAVAGSAVCTPVPAGSFTAPIAYGGECDAICEDLIGQNSEFLKLLKNKPPIGINIFSQYDNTTHRIPDARANGYDVVVYPPPAGTEPPPELVTVTQPAFGAVNHVTSLYGTTMTRIQWPSTLPPMFTVCFSTRWDSVNQGRVLGCGPDNYFGHRDNSGSVYYNGFRQVASTEHSNEWIVMCAKDGLTRVSAVIRDQVDVSPDHRVEPEAATACTLDINMHADVSNFHVHSVYVWDVTLSTAEMKVVTAGIRKELGGIPFSQSTAVVPIRDLGAYYRLAYPTSITETPHVDNLQVPPISVSTMYANPTACADCRSSKNIEPTWIEPTPCATGFFAAMGTTGDSCHSCPIGMSTVGIGSVSISDCVCATGLYKDPYGICVMCTPGSSSPVGSEAYNACTCTATGMSYRSHIDYSVAEVSSSGVVSTGMSHTCVLFQDIGQIKCWGYNRYGQLGRGSRTIDPVGDNPDEMGTNLPFVDFGSTEIHVKDVQLGSGSTCVLISDGRMKCWGLGRYGMLGVPKRGRSTLLYDQSYLTSWELAGDNVNFGDNRTVVSMSVMYESVCAILDNKQVKCFGRNNYGQLGYGDSLDRGSDTITMGNTLPAVDLGTNRYAVRLFPSSSHTMCALLDSAEVKCWGHNGHLALGMGLSITHNIGDDASEMGDNLVAIAIPAGRNVINLWVAHHVVAILDDNTMITWGGVH